MSDLDRDGPYAVFRPRRSRLVALSMAALVVVIFTVVGITVPRGGHTGWTSADTAMMIAFGLLIGAFLLRYAMVQAKPTAEGLTVRNLIHSRTVAWSEIVNLQFGGGQPWLLLDLNDTEQLAVMAIQRSDGPRAMQEAQRLAALVEASNTAR